MSVPGRLAAALALAAATGLPAAWPGPASAASDIYQCGPGLYSQRPCTEGRRYVPSQPVHEPTDDGRQAAAEVAQRQARLAADLQKDRLEREQQARGRGPVNLSPPTQADERQRPAKARPKKPQQPRGSSGRKGGKGSHQSQAGKHGG